MMKLIIYVNTIILSKLQTRRQKIKIPFLDLGAAYRELKTEIDVAVLRVMNSGLFILGPEVDAFEEEWAKYCDAKYAVGLANGLDALIMALQALDVGPGDEVIVPSNTYIATWLAVSAVGATPVPVEPNSNTYNIDINLIAAAITQKTKVILPVHLYGQPADMDPILTLARQHDIRVVEDAAQAHGAYYKKKRIGGHGDIVCWSFYPGKNLGAMGDGGAITTNRADLADKVKVLSNYGSRTKYVNEVQGVNSRLDPIQAAVLGVKLKYLDEWSERRRKIADIYTKALKGTDLILPYVPDWAEPVWHLYVVRSNNRNTLQRRIEASGIGTLIHYPIPPHMQEAYSGLGISDNHFPLASQISDEILSLPIGPQMEIQQASYVCNIICDSG
jgi:dTDP-4-amino-4,6-dideoxygalactose transaminase